jgi:hypothetical protein
MIPTVTGCGSERTHRLEHNQAAGGTGDSRHARPMPGVRDRAESKVGPIILTENLNLTHYRKCREVGTNPGLGAARDSERGKGAPQKIIIFPLYSVRLMLGFVHDAPWLCCGAGVDGENEMGNWGRIRTSPSPCANNGLGGSAGRATVVCKYLLCAGRKGPAGRGLRRGGR